MRRHSNPSPIPSTAAPLVGEDSASLVPTRPTSPTGPRDHTETQRSLQQASAALEAAYRRIRQVRRNLLEVTGGMPLDHPTRSSDVINVGPDHDAIVLTDPYSAYVEQLRHLTDSPTMAAEPELRGTNGFLELPPLNTPSPADLTSPRTQNLPDLSHRPYPLPRRAQLYQFSRRRDDYMDDPSTSLGRRVAAREAASASNSEPGSTSATLNSLYRFDGNPAQLLASIERDIDLFRSLARQRRGDAAPAPAPGPDGATNSASTRPSLVVNDTVSRSESAGSGSRVMESFPTSRRRRLLIHNNRLSGSFQPDRLSLLSNISVQNLPTPVSAGNPRPLLFEEPSTYLPAANFTEPDTRPNFAEDSIEEQRNYIIRRRYNADGEEHVHPINLEWIDETPMWIGPGGILREHERRARESSQSVQEGGPQRRRGWARLDADGNEIPSDEEEELERIRAEYRIQAQTRPRTYYHTTEAQSHPGFHSLQAATTSTSLIPDESASILGSIPRVRLNVRDSRLSYESVKQPVAAVDVITRKETSYSSSVFCNPLPMPIEEMVWSPPKRKPPRVVTVPGHASLAGR
ncbi:hypothetical protein D9615_006366 [Tricholomella constricta]|uniref:Uncharacterized protein n=1 Tax=Tricholomella constricta TaxID=117010 RepID=A0A8H5M1J3_9AGAR|nr:hypothetical protein D9615_006366 [Tricholomella constricta]